MRRRRKKRSGGGVGDGRAFREKPDEKSEKRLYLCTMAAQQNTDQAGSHFTYLARGSAPLVILTTSMSRHPNPYGERSEKKKVLKHFWRVFQSCLCKLMMHPLSFFLLLPFLLGAYAKIKNVTSATSSLKAANLRPFPWFQRTPGDQVWTSGFLQGQSQTKTF